MDTLWIRKVDPFDALGLKWNPWYVTSAHGTQWLYYIYIVTPIKNRKVVNKSIGCHFSICFGFMLWKWLPPTLTNTATIVLSDVKGTSTSQGLWVPHRCWRHGCGTNPPIGLRLVWHVWSCLGAQSLKSSGEKHDHWLVKAWFSHHWSPRNHLKSPFLTSCGPFLSLGILVVSARYRHRL